MIKVDLWGRMGNQMFQYAFACNTAKKMNTFFLIAPTEKFELSTYFKLGILTRFCYSSSFFTMYRRIIHRLCKKETISQISEDTVFIKNKVTYRGFFQSQDFFIESKDTISKRFILKNKWILQFQDKYGNLFNHTKKNIVLHFRRTDYVSFGNVAYGGDNMCLPMTYYNNCLNLIENIEDYNIICISDDIEFVKDYYKEKKEFLFFSNSAILDFQMILNADIAIIANSSFSWWAAYLNNRPNKIVYAPQFWLGFKVNKEIPAKIIPTQFKSVSVY